MKVTELSILFSAVAVGVNVWAAHHMVRWLRWMFIAIASLALMYCASYFWLLFNYDRAADWSAALRPVGTASWLIAWCGPQLFIVRYIRNRATDVAAAAQAKLKELGVDCDTCSHEAGACPYGFVGCPYVKG